MEAGTYSCPDAIIMVMGMTGAGKSTFISQLTGQDAGVGHSLQSCTQEVNMHCLELYNRRVYLVDTPGFNDTWRSDFDILREIAFFMGQTYRKQLMLAGIIYLHRITDNRVTGSGVKNFAMLQAFCGSEAAGRAILATSMWDTIPAETPDFQAALQREKELIQTQEFWGRLNDHGSETRRWAGDRLSAHLMVDDILRIHDTNEMKPTRFHREYVDEGRELSETSAGQELLKEHREAQESQRLEIEELRRSWKQAEERRANTVAKKLQKQRLALNQELKEAEAAEARLRVSLKSLAEEKEAEYARLLRDVQNEREQIDADLARREREYQRLQDDSAYNDLVLRETLQDMNAAANEPLALSKVRRYKSKEEVQRRRREEDEIRAQWEQEQKMNEQKKQALQKVIKKVKKRKVMKRNLIPLLGILAGSGVIAAGAATGLIPLIAAGVGVFGSAANNLNFSRETKGKGKEWKVDDCG